MKSLFEVLPTALQGMAGDILHDRKHERVVSGFQRELERLHAHALVMVSSDLIGQRVFGHGLKSFLASREVSIP
jgi:hypothetical protein